jgi:hypothetical protein
MAKGFHVSTHADRWSAIDDSVRRARELFPILTGAHWLRSLRWYRSAEGQRNPVREQIEQAIRRASLAQAPAAEGGPQRPEILNLKLGKTESGNVGGNHV